jgi:hypothetical protein
MARRSPNRSRYHKSVRQDRNRIAGEQRQAKGEPNDQERWADELVRKLRKGN